ncbi:tRNA methyltransferase [Phanerochaete sordida]|uniref:tRNA methyltransferase n=1 Tax=Phanerochaete sordida TaxID=48140 RepID=A0A9P3LF20_9APHY|nr:tRNA methyltransferase [Phanerochaete sordida]
MPSSRPSTPDDAETRHVDKKPRLEVELEGANAAPAQLDAPVEAMVLPPEEGEADGWAESLDSKRPSKKAARKMARRAMAKGVLSMPEPYSTEHILFLEAKELLGAEAVKAAEEGTARCVSPLPQYTELELTVSAMSSIGESLAVAPAPYPPWVVVTPFALPGEVFRAKVYSQGFFYSRADLIEIITPNPELRDDSRVKCKYFTQCGGCQYQMLSYETQLDFKRNVVVKAYKTLSGLPDSEVPEVQPTIGSPLQYGYRTKITPHFANPKPLIKKHGLPADGGKPDWLRIGFNKIGTRSAIDIEDCPIATPVLNEALPRIREDVVKNISTYPNGVSLLLRESLGSESASSKQWAERMEETKICVTDHNGTIRERVGDMLFEYTAGNFFQNNNSVLVPLTSYVRDAIFAEAAPTHLVDAYCGSGLFAIVLAPHFARVRGIELSADAIRAAEANAARNGLPADKVAFMAGDAARIFDTVADFPRAETALIIDPPRKGSDAKFIDQLVRFACGTVAYVSCNVHTQARDVGMILRRSAQVMQGKKYVLTSVRGFDLFPQTAHVESVAILKLVDA